MGDPVTELLNKSTGVTTDRSLYMLAEIAVQLKRIADGPNIMTDTTVYPVVNPGIHYIPNISAGIVECGQITTTCLNNT